MATEADVLHELETAMVHVFASKCMAIAGFCILCYDHLLTFSDEVEFIWKQQRSLVSAFFFLNRYIAPLILSIDIYDKGGLANFIPKSFCVRWYYGESVWNLVSFALVHVIVALRVRAIWGRPRWISWTLLVWFIVYFVATTVIAFKFLVDFSHGIEYSPIFRICLGSVSPYLWLCWLPALIFESLLFVFTLIKAVEHANKNVDTPVLRVLYRDGIIYFVVICCCSLFNMVVWLAAPPTLVILSKYFVLAIVPTMGARLVLNLRSSRREDLVPTARSTEMDDAAYEMYTRGASQKGTRHDTATQGGPHLLTFQEHDALTVRDRIYLNRIKASTRWNIA